MRKANPITLIGVKGKWVPRKEITAREAAELLNPDQHGHPQLANPKRGPWYAVVREWQDSYVFIDGRHYVEITADLLIRTVPWWVNGSKGKVGKGGWQKQIPMRPFAEHLTSVAPFAEVWEKESEIWDDFDYLATVPVPDPEPAPLLAAAEFDPMTSSEAAQLLGCSVTTLHARRKGGILKATKTTTGLYVFDRRDVEALRASGRVRLPKRRQSVAGVH